MYDDDDGDGIGAISLLKRIDCVETIETVKIRFEDLKKELQLCMKELEAATKAAKSVQGGAASSESEEEEDGDGDDDDDDRASATMDLVN